MLRSLCIMYMGASSNIEETFWLHCSFVTGDLLLEDFGRCFQLKQLLTLLLIAYLHVTIPHLLSATLPDCFSAC